MASGKGSLMALEVLSIDHIYITVSNLSRSTVFYDAVMKLLGFHKGTGSIDGQPHVHYFNRALQYTLRPARSDAALHDQLVPGLHHLCFQVTDMNAVDLAAQGLSKLGIEVSEPGLYLEFGADYYAVYFQDPDGILLEIVNRTLIRDIIRDNWEKLEHFENPLSKAGLV
ncbi:MAG: VOC family protein [Candidatus Wallbacteria bacterium]|nr:VOC family protein [Candidatus Wallbacteria bacterium]